MMCLLDSHDMLGFIDGTIKCNQGKGDSKRSRECKRSDTLVKGWIFGSLTEDVMDTVVGLHTSHQVWKQLENNYVAAPKSISTVNDRVSGMHHLCHSDYKDLYFTILIDQWEHVGEYFTRYKDALTAKITYDDETPLHIAIDGQSERCIENILQELTSESLPTLVCKRQENPLHRAALVGGDPRVAKLLVKKNPTLLFLSDMEGLLPIHRAMFGAHANTFNYLVEVTLRHIKLSEQEGHDNPFKGLHAAALLKRTIRNGLFEVAYELINEYPEMARTTKDFYSLLRSIAGNLDAYLSGTKYNFYQNFVYHHVQIQDHSLNNAYESDRDIENQSLDTTPIAKCWRSCFYSVIRWIYAKLWKVLLHGK